MTRLTINGSGVASDSSLTINAGQKYLFEWAEEIAAGPSAGTLSALNVWGPETTGQPAIRKADGTAATWDLSAVDSGGVEFRSAHAGNLSVIITGGTPSTYVYFNLIPIPG